MSFQYDFVKRLRISVLAATLSALSWGPVHSDETSEFSDGILVENAQIKVTSDPKIANLEFAVSNLGVEDVTLIRLHSNISENIDIYYVSSDGKKRAISDLTILQEETLDLSSSHIKVDLLGMTKPLPPGSLIEFKLEFREFTTTAVAHVHG